MDLLANWLWQGCAVALAATVVLHASPRTSATTRYRGWCLALALVVVLPLVPGLIALGQPSPSAIVVGASPSSSLAVSLPPLPWWPAALMVAAWMGWLVASLLRLGGALTSLRRAKAIATSFPGEREARLHAWLSVRSTGRHAALVVSEEVRSAGVLGLGAPAIAVSPAMLRELSNDELDQVLVHEWAHVQRRDDIGRLCQVLITAVAGLHPAVWWINRRLHVERETACDDWTVNLTGAPKDYAACLTKLAAMGNDGLLVPAAWSSSALTTRIVRLLDRRRNRSTRFTIASLAVAPVLAAIAVTAASVELVVSRPIELASLNRVVNAVQAAGQTVAAQKPVAQSQRATSGPATAGAPAPARAPTPGAALEPARLEPGTVDAAAHTSRSSPATSAGPTAPTPDLERALPSVAAIALETESLPGTIEAAPTPNAPSATPGGARVTPWGVAADAGIAIGDAGVAIGDAGVAVGRGSKKGAVATAGFFTRVGKSIASVF